MTTETETTETETEKTDDVIGTENQLTTEKSADSEDSTTEDVIGATAEDEESGGEESTTEGDEETVPESYAGFDLPEGFEISDEYMDRMTPVFKELGITQSQAQKLITAHVEHAQANEEHRLESFNELTKNWLEQARSDEEIGGDNFDQSVKNANLAVREMGSPALATLLKSHGIGNHPEIIRVFSKMGALVAEDQPGSSATPTQGQQDTASALYPNDPPRK